MNSKSIAVIFFSAALASTTATGSDSSAAAAGKFPTKPIRLIVPFPPGGTTDLLARVIGKKLTEATGQQVIIDNRAGASGIIGTQIVAAAAPDGYIVLWQKVIRQAGARFD
jgi:tripartite-type tricarboxylate transporter receptor subunit TctC